MPDTALLRCVEGSARQALQFCARLLGQGIISVARNEELERFPRSLPAGGFVFLCHRDGRIAGDWHGGRAACLAALLPAVVRFGSPDHGRLFSVGQMIRSRERREDADQTG
ncbi:MULTISPECIES: hypothetical protein [unclassified Bradyrhizobium]|uniref:hypothetical protein n=1 Tax=unclassified Bradyrhizobium TaxID=2631580 RepID=UPI001404F62D